MSYPLCACLAIGALALSTGIAAAATTNSKNTGVVKQRRVHHVNTAHRWRYAAPSQLSYRHAAPAGAIWQPGGYWYLPGHGILDEACDLPTSACPNTERDVQ
ncbi:MAG: hypothetical protein WBD95_01090 [Xanthobacteraceae bacterium]